MTARAAVAADAPVKADTGKFTLSIQENVIGTETFTINASGSSEADEAVTLGANAIKSHTSVTMRNGVIVKVATDAGASGKFTLFIDPLGKGTLTADDKPLPQDPLPQNARLLPFSNFGPHFLANAVAAYDKIKGGAQAVNLLIVDAVGLKGVPVLPATLTSRGETPRQVGGKAVATSRYALSLNGPVGPIEIEILTDADGRILFWNVPGQKYAAIREGFEDLARPEKPADPLLSQPTFEVKKETNIRVPLRDGVTLAADVYRPDAPADAKFPVILQRTCYGRASAFEGAYWARRGYVFVAQDVRGKFDSGGVWEPWVNEGRDGFDSVEWCAAQPWSNGAVGMIGASYLGFTQWAAARENPPHLKCLVPIVSPPDPYYNVPYAYGTFFLYGSVWWSGIVDGQTMNPIQQFRDVKPFMTLPLKNVDRAVLGKTVPFFQTWLKHPANDAYWRDVSFNELQKQPGAFPVLPALHVSGWFDGDGIGTKRNYAAMIEGGQKNQKLVYGPWGHAVNSSTKIGDLDFGQSSLRDLDTLYLRWFDHHLKGVANHIDEEPPVEAFLMGRNEWRGFFAWPPREAKPTRWYFHSQGNANTDRGGGTLSLAPPKASEPADTYTYNPAKPFMAKLEADKPVSNPKPTVPSGKQAATSAPPAPDAAANPVQAGGVADPQVLVYTSAPLPADVIVAGPIEIRLTAATSARDTDWWASLMEVDERGKTTGFTQGIVRARFADGGPAAKLLPPNAPHTFTLDLWALGNVFRKGHRLRVAVSSSCFPLYDRNLNTGDPNPADATRMVTAKQTVYHDKARLSYLVLPTLPK